MMAPDVARIESAIEQAARRGDFDDLPGAGKPLDLPSSHDPDWWINQRIASGDIDRQALLPVVVLLRKEFENRDETLAALPHERAAREYAEEFTERVHQDRRENPFQTMLAPAWDPEDAAARWRELRAQGAKGRESREQLPRSAGPEPLAARSPRPRRWPFGRRR